MNVSFLYIPRRYTYQLITATINIVPNSLFPLNSDNQVWELQNTGVERPQLINEVFPNLPNRGIDAAFYYPETKRTYFFKVMNTLLFH